MFIEGVPPTAMWDCFCCEAIEREEKLTIPASRIDIYLQQEASSSVLPIRCKWGWNLPPKSYCAFPALCVVRTLDFTGRRLEEGEQEERQSSGQCRRKSLWLLFDAEADLVEPLFCFTLSASCLQLASHVQLLLEAALTSAMRRMLQGRLTNLYTHRGVVFNHSHCCCGTSWESHPNTHTHTCTHTQTRCYTRCFKDIATAGTGSVDAEVVQLIYPFCVARIHSSKKWSWPSQCSCKLLLTGDGNISFLSFGKFGENWKKMWRKYGDNLWNILVSHPLAHWF